VTSYRRASVEDAETVADLVERSYQHYVPVIGLRPAPMDADYRAAITDDVVWLAEQDARIVAVIVLHAERDHLVVENVAVDPDRQGDGIGSALLGIAEDEAARLGLRQIRLFTHELMAANIAYYGRRGYVETHRQAEHGFSRVFFTKEL
jgi:N-acetylglutamate synthase-like GNAT family acetyltransferase